MTGKQQLLGNTLNKLKAVFLFSYFTCDLLYNKTSLLDSVFYLLHDLGKALQIEMTIFQLGQ